MSMKVFIEVLAMVLVASKVFDAGFGVL